MFIQTDVKLLLNMAKYDKICFDWLSERVRWTHSGFPALVAQEKVLFLVIIINPLLTRFVRSKWLNIGVVLFSVFITSTGIRLFAFFLP